MVKHDAGLDAFRVRISGEFFRHLDGGGGCIDGDGLGLGLQGEVTGHVAISDLACRFGLDILHIDQDDLGFSGGGATSAVTRSRN